jgi:hypothetical protein
MQAALRICAMNRHAARSGHQINTDEVFGTHSCLQLPRRTSGGSPSFSAMPRHLWELLASHRHPRIGTAADTRQNPNKVAGLKRESSAIQTSRVLQHNRGQSGPRGCSNQLPSWTQSGMPHRVNRARRPQSPTRRLTINARERREEKDRRSARLVNVDFVRCAVSAYQIRVLDVWTGN